MNNEWIAATTATTTNRTRGQHKQYVKLDNCNGADKLWELIPEYKQENAGIYVAAAALKECCIQHCAKQYVRYVLAEST